MSSIYRMDIWKKTCRVKNIASRRCIERDLVDRRSLDLLPSLACLNKPCAIQQVPTAPPSWAGSLKYSKADISSLSNMYNPTSYLLVTHTLTQSNRRSRLPFAVRLATGWTNPNPSSHHMFLSNHLVWFLVHLWI